MQGNGIGVERLYSTRAYSLPDQEWITGNTKSDADSQCADCLALDLEGLIVRRAGTQDLL
jgi:hypothetical protein